MVTSTDDTLFHKTRISSTVTQESALDFYREHGIYYQEDAEIGELAATLGNKALSLEGMADFISLALKDQVNISASILHTLADIFSAPAVLSTLFLLAVSSLTMSWVETKENSMRTRPIPTKTIASSFICGIVELGWNLLINLTPNRLKVLQHLTAYHKSHTFNCKD